MPELIPALPPRSVFLLGVVFLCSCSGQPTTPDLQHFRTLITQEGTKRFELRMPSRARDDAILRRERQAMERSRDRRPPQNKPLTEKQIARQVDAVIAATKFCREGYILLGRHAGHTAQAFRGECKDAATASDRQRFPNTITRW